MRILRYIFTAILICGISHANAATSPCLETIGNDQETFVNVIKSEILKGRAFDQSLVDREKNKIYNLIVSNILLRCFDVKHLDDFNNDIVDTETLEIPFRMDGKFYKFNVNTSKLFEHMEMPVGILVTNLRDKKAGDVIKNTDVGSSGYFFNTSCSPHWGMTSRISDTAAINRAGKATLTTYAGDEFFIDPPTGRYQNRAFPGLIIAARDQVGGSEDVVVYQNYKVGRDTAKRFADALQHTPCANDRLAVDVVSLTTVPTTSGDRHEWAIGAGVVGGTMAVAGLASATGATVGILGTVAGVASAIPVAGWVVAGIAVVAAGAFALSPSSLADIQQMMILDGPYLIKQ